MPRHRITAATLALTGVALTGLSLAACHRGHHHHMWGEFSNRPMTVGSSLNCPEQLGRLNRVSLSADGRSCAYSGDQDETVSLTLTPLDGASPQMALAPVEAALKTELPGPAMTEPTPPTDGDTGGDHAHIDAPFVHVDADNDHAHVKVLGITIDADNQNANVHTDWGSKSAMIKAGPQGAEVRVDNDRTGGADMVYILARDHAGPNGYRTVGYEARGPIGGPLVVAVFKSRSRHENQHGFRDHDLDQLLDLNVRS